MDVSRVRQGEKIAAISAIVLILIMFIFDWFGLKLSGASGAFGGEGAGNAWRSYGFIDLVLFVTALAAIALAWLSASQTRVNLPVAASAVVAALGVISIVLILFSIINPPDFGAPSAAFDQGLEHTRKIGVFLGLIATAALTYGAFIAMREEGTSLGAEADRLRDSRGSGPGTGTGGGTPPPPPPPPTTTPPPSGGGTTAP